MHLRPHPYKLESSAPYREGWLYLLDYETFEKADQSASSFSHSIFWRDVTVRVVGPSGKSLGAYKNGEKVQA